VQALIPCNQRPRLPHLADQLSSAYDAFLEIQRHVKHTSQQALGRGPEWDQQNVCPPCLYKIKDEPALKFSFLAAMDGNNSLKLVDSTFRSGSMRHDDRISDAPRWIKPEDVDIFKDEVNKVSAHFNGCCFI